MKPGALFLALDPDIPITPGWSYAVRMYQPREEIITGS